MRSMVRNAAKLAVYVDTMISVKNHQALPTIRPDADLPRRHNNQLYVNKHSQTHVRHYFTTFRVCSARDVDKDKTRYIVLC